MTEKERKSPFIHYFDKTPEGIRCPHFWILSASLGCPFSCTYCFLRKTLFRQKDELPILYTNLDKMVEEVKQWLEKTKTPSVLNAGELSDALAFESKLHLLDKLVPLFAAQNKHKLLFLTKSADRFINYLNLNKPTDRVILSWSINSHSVWRDFEKGTPNPFERLAAAYTYMKRGWAVRIRIDPIMPIENWTEEYGKIIDVINVMPFVPRTTLGTIRAFPSLAKFCPSDVFKHCFDNKDPDGRLRLPAPVRESIYRWFARRLKESPALCKETDEVAKGSGLTAKCNCEL